MLWHTLYFQVSMSWFTLYYLLGPTQRFPLFCLLLFAQGIQSSIEAIFLYCVLYLEKTQSKISFCIKKHIEKINRGVNDLKRNILQTKRRETKSPASRISLGICEIPCQIRFSEVFTAPGDLQVRCKELQVTRHIWILWQATMKFPLSN